MVRVFRCHCFASKQVIPISIEPLMICAADDKVFVATTDCEILVFSVANGTAVEIQKLPTISQVERIIFNPFKNYIATVEKKKSWKKTTHSVRVYLNWEKVESKNSKPRTKVRVAGKSHAQHVSSSSSQNVMEIIEIPIEKHATGIAVCSQTGNFAVACGTEVKLCSVHEKTVGNSDKTYLDVEIFLELCWNFPIHSIALSEEFVVCCSKTEVQGIRVRYDEGFDRKSLRRSVASPLPSHDSGSVRGSIREGTLIGSHTPSPYSNSPNSVSSGTDVFFVDDEIGGIDTFENKLRFRQKSLNSYNAESNNDLSIVGRRQPVVNNQRSGTQNTLTDKSTLPVDDENFVEWNFSQAKISGDVSCLPGLHTDRGRSQCHHHFQTVTPPVLADCTGGKTKSSSGVQAETVLYLSDIAEKEEWMSVMLIPSYVPGPSDLIHMSMGTDRMTSTRHPSRTSVCCFLSGTRSGYLYELSPCLNKVSSYQYTDKASKVSCGDHQLFVVTQSGIETYTSRWATVALESKGNGGGGVLWNGDNADLVLPPSSLNICLCGHEPFLGVVDMCAGGNFVALLSKMEYASSSEETVWSFYIVHSQTVLEQCKDMLQFAESIRATGPSSYIHLLQEADLLLSTYIAHLNVSNPELDECLTRVKRLLGDVYAQPGEENWRLCHSYYNSLGISIDYVVKQAFEQAGQTSPPQFGKGILDFLDKRLFAEDADVTRLPTPATAEDILHIYSLACPDQLSRLVLLSHLTGYKPEKALQHLNTWLSSKKNGGKPMSAIDKLSLVQVHLNQCEVEVACTHLDSISTSSLVEVCCEHPKLIHTGMELKALSSLGQLMRWRRPVCMMEVLVEMMDRGFFSLDSLLVLLQSQNQTDIYLNTHVKQVLELILMDTKRSGVFEEAVNLLCEVYISLLKKSTTANVHEFNQKTQTKFSALQGNGYFAIRHGWLDELPPFHSPEEMLRPCLNLEMKRVSGGGPRVGSKGVSVLSSVGVSGEEIRCPCCLCNGNMLKLQSLLCSPSVTPILARHILDILPPQDKDNSSNNNDNNRQQRHIGQLSYSWNDSLDSFWDSIQLLCLIKIDINVATLSIVDKYPAIVANYSSLCYQGDVIKYSFLVKCMENVLKSCATSKPVQGEQSYVKAYKELLTKLAELFPPSQFIPLLPKDGSLFFLLPYITHNLELESTNSLKCDIMNMGNELLSQIG